MNGTDSIRAAAILLAVGLWSAVPAWGETRLGAQGAEGTPNRRQDWLVPTQDQITPSRAVLFRPPGKVHALNGVSFSVDAAAANAVAVNSGVITAQGGQVAVLASALGDVMATVINQTGVIRATSAAERNGMIVLSGGSQGVVSVTGELTATGLESGQSGGTVAAIH